MEACVQTYHILDSNGRVIVALSLGSLDQAQKFVDKNYPGKTFVDAERPGVRHVRVYNPQKEYHAEK